MSTSVGVINFDLIIKDNLEKQLNDIEKRISSSLSKPVESISQSIEQALKSSMQKASENIEHTMTSAFESVREEATKLGQRIKESLGQTTIPASSVPIMDTSAITEATKEIRNLVAMMLKLNRSVEESATTAISSFGEITSQSGKASSKIKEQTQKISKDVREMLGEFEVSSDPTERLRQDLRITEDRIALLQKKWQELQYGFTDEGRIKGMPLSEIIKQSNSVEQQILSLQTHYEQTQAAIRMSTAETAEELRTRVSAAANEASQSFNAATTPVERLQQKLQLNQTALVNLQGELGRLQQVLAGTDDALEQERLIAKINRIKAQVLSLSESSVRITSQINAATSASAERLRQVSASAAAATAQGFTAANTPVERLRQKIELANSSMSSLEQEIKQLQGLLSVTDDTVEQEKIVSKINKIKSKMISLADTIEKLQAKYEEALSAIRMSTTQATETAKVKISEVLRIIGKNSVKTLTLPFKLIGKLGTGLKTTLVGGLKIAGKGFKTLGKSALNSLNPIKGAMNSVQRTAKKFSTGVSRAFRTAFMMVGVYAAIRGLKSVISDACNSSDEFKKSLNEVKANLKIAFVPIMNSVMPAINSLMSGLAKVTKGIATFTSELFGSTYAQSLETAKKAQEASKKVTDTGKKISAEVKKNSTYLASFDEMNVAQDDSDTDTGNDSSDSNDEDESGIDYSALSGEGIKLPDWAEKLKQAIKKGDWKGVGATLANAVNGVFQKLDFGKAAQKLSNGIKGVLDTATEFLLTIDWQMIGGKIADFINNIDFEGIMSRFGAFLSAKFKAILDFLIGLIEGIKWKELTLKLMGAIGGFLESVDWLGLLKRAAELLGAAVGAIGTVLVTVAKAIWDALKESFEKTKEYFKGYIDDAGGNVIAGFLKGMYDAVLNIGHWIYEHIFKPFIDGFKKTFDIHSPSKVMAEQGVYIIQGLLNGIASKIEAVKAKFKEILSIIKEIFTNIPSWFKEKFADAWNKIKSVFSKVGEFFGGIWDTIKSRFTSIGTKIGESIGNAFKSAVNAVIETVENGINFVPDAINGAIDLINNLPGVNISPMPTVSIPRLAKGGLATAPTLAMVGDNKRANIDPEVIAPLSKLENMLTGGAEMNEVAELLKEILITLKNLKLNESFSIDGKVFLRILRQLSSEYERQTGVKPF